MRYNFLDFEINSECFSVHKRGHLIGVEPRVFDLLVYLIERRERVVRTPELLEAVWGGTKVGVSAVARCICVARSLLGLPTAIRTVYSRGYQWALPVAVNRVGHPSLSSRSRESADYPSRPLTEATPSEASRRPRLHNADR
jgi:DNA-binding winged helix-turn-helix (wHTH) protein